MEGLVVAAPSSGAGKTTLALGLMAAFRARGVPVQPAKSGPDFIDPGFHGAACGRPSLTLDAWAASPGRLRGRVGSGSGALMIVEGAMGLFDGARDGTALGRGSTADVAEALGLPVLLVLDIARAGQGVAAVAEGLLRHRAGMAFAGAILNRAGSARHGEMVRAAVETVMPVHGILPRGQVPELPSRHLGLVQAVETAGLSDVIGQLGEAVAGTCDLSAIRAAARPVATGPAARGLRPLGQRIAVARDAAFAFAYAHHLADWLSAGAEILPFSPLADEVPDASADAVYLPGGYPELHAGRLAGAARFRAGMHAAAARGAVIHGECGGYMVLGEGLEDADANRHAMLGLLSLETSFARPRMTLGYRVLEACPGAPWQGRLMAHEFHFSRQIRAVGAPLYAARDAAGQEVGEMGLIAGTVSGSYAHIIEATD